MTRIIAVFSRFLLLGLMFSSLVSGIAYMFDLDKLLSAFFVGFYVFLFFMTYLPTRLLFHNAWKKVSEEMPESQKRGRISILTACCFAFLIWQTRSFADFLAFRIFIVSSVSFLSAAVLMMLFHSNRYPLKKFWHFMIAKPKK